MNKDGRYLSIHPSSQTLVAFRLASHITDRIQLSVTETPRCATCTCMLPGLRLCRKDFSKVPCTATCWPRNNCAAQLTAVHFDLIFPQMRPERLEFIASVFSRKLPPEEFNFLQQSCGLSSAHVIIKSNVFTEMPGGGLSHESSSVTFITIQLCSSSFTAAR